MRLRTSMVMALLIVAVLVPPSWGWIRGSWGFRGGGLGVYVGGPWWPCAYPYYGPSGPYYGPYPPDYYNAPYAYPQEVTAQTQEPSASVDNSGRNLKRVSDQLARMRDRLDYKYQDGDLSQTELNAGLRYLDEIEKLAHSEADANGGTLTGNEENSLLRQIQQADPAIHQDPSAPYPPVTPYSSIPESSPMPRPAPTYAPSPNSTTVSDLLLELNALLDQKLKDGAITNAQHDAEAEYLHRIDSQAQAAMRSNGTLSPEEEEQCVEQLHRAYYAINHDLVVN